MTTTPLAFLRATHAAAHAEAEAAQDGDSGEWFVGDDWNVYRAEDQAPGEDAEENRLVVYGDVKPQSEHIARHDPAATLRRIAADRKLIAVCEKVLAVDGWEYDDAPKLAEHVISNLAAGWGWTEET